MLHILPHWYWEGHEGQEGEVWAYCNQESVELFLNGASLGAQPVKKINVNQSINAPMLRLRVGRANAASVARRPVAATCSLQTSETELVPSEGWESALQGIPMRGHKRGPGQGE